MCRFELLPVSTNLIPPQPPPPLPLPQTLEPEELYLLVDKLVRCRVRRTARWGGDPEDLLHDIFVTVAQSLRDGVIRNPERLGAYILATAYRQSCTSFHKAIRSKHMIDIDDASRNLQGRVRAGDLVEDSEQSRRIEALLEPLNDADQQILRRFYLDEVKWETIAAEMNLTSTQFRLRKARALTKARRLVRGASVDEFLKPPRRRSQES